MMKKLPWWFLTIGLAFVFGAFGLGKLLTPLEWIGWLPGWMDGFLNLDAVQWAKTIGVIELAMALSLFIPKIKKYASVLVALHLIAVMKMTGLSDIGIRDFGLFFMALALLALNSKADEKPTP